MAKVKKWYLSKTIWFNMIMAGLAAAEASVNLLQPVAGERSFALLAVTLAVGNAILRVVSTQGLSR